MNILSLDLGTTTGWGLRIDKSQIHSGSQSFKPGRFEGGGMRYLKFSGWLSDMNANVTKGEKTGIEFVAFEEVRRHIGVDAAHAYGGFLATLTSWCEAREIPYQAVPVGTIKKFATGKGNAGKAQMIEAMKAKGHSPVDDNEADALALLHWAIENNPKGSQHETANIVGVRPTSNSKPRRRVSLVPVPVARRRVTGRKS